MQRRGERSVNLRGWELRGVECGPLRCGRADFKM